MLLWYIHNLPIDTPVIDGILLSAEVVVRHKERGNERNGGEADRSDGDVSIHNGIGADGTLANWV